MADGLGLDPWWDEPAYKTCNTFHLRGLFILRKLREHDSTRFHDVMTDLYRDEVPDPQDIGTFEWQTTLAYMGASEQEIKDVQKRMGRVGGDGDGPRRLVVQDQRRMPGEGYSQNPLKRESGGTPCHHPPVRKHRSASSSWV
jgi:hypothetical protein